MIALSQAFAALVLLAQNVTIPQNDGWVTDLAGMLSSDQEHALEALCESYRAGTTREIALVTLPDLGGQAIEDVAFAIGRAWKIGTEEEEDGALLVVSKNEKKIRIEVSRGLEGELTDSISGRIIRNEITPKFKEGDFYGGLRAGLEAIHATLGGEYAPAEEETGKSAERGAGFLGVLVLFLVIVAITRGRRRGFGGGMPWWLLPMVLGSHGSSRGSSGWGSLGGGGGGGGGFRGFGGGGGFRGGGATGGW